MKKYVGLLSFFIFLTSIDLTAQETQPTMIFLGASITSGFGLPKEQAFPAVIGRLLEKEGMDIRVINAAQPGASTRDGLRQLQPYLKGRYKLKCLVICLGLSDAVYTLPTNEIAKNLKEILVAARKFNPEMQIFVMQGRIFQRHIMTRLPSPGSDYELAYDTVFRNVAQEENVILLPFFLSGVAGVSELNQSDLLHPNAAGAKVIAEKVWAALRQSLGKP